MLGPITVPSSSLTDVDDDRDGDVHAAAPKRKTVMPMSRWCMTFAPLMMYLFQLSSNIKGGICRRPAPRMRRFGQAQCSWATRLWHLSHLERG